MDRMSEKRINEMVEAVMKVARGDYSVQVELSGQNDEFDSLAMGLNMMIDDVRAGFEGLDRQRKEVNALNKKLEKEITDHKTVEELYQTLANSSPVGVYTVQDGKFQFANPQFQKYTGYTEDELLGMVSLSIVHPEDRERVRENAVEMLKGNRLSPYEFRYISKGGETIWAIETVTSIHYEGKRATLGNFMDITERKQAEEALEESRKRFRDMANFLPQTIFEMDESGNFTFLSRQGFLTFGYTLEEIREYLNEPERYTAEYSDSLQTFVPADRERVKKNRQRVLNGEDIGSVEYTALRRDGSTFPVEVFYAPIIHAGKRVGLRGILVDITERKRAEEELRESEERYRDLFENTTDLIQTVNPEGRFIHVNRAWRETLGYTEEEMAGLTLFDIIHPDYLEHCQAMFRRVISGESVSGIEAGFLARDGSTILVEGNASCKFVDGKPVHTRGIFRNITERKRTEQELQKVERLESVGTLAGGIAHDFNNILTGILGNISLAKRYVESGGKAAHRLQEAEKASLRARDLTQQLLTFTKGGEPVRRTASIRELIQDSAQFALRGSRVRCEFALADDLRAVEIDEGQMNQVISNLVINADEAMPEGGTLNIEARNTVIEEETTLPLPEGKYVQVTVADHGVGISEEHLGRIFEPYFTTKQKGSGLGLATAYSIIQNHDGHISAESKLGAGTTFHIYLPASERRTPESREAAAQPAPVTRVRILVMDDEEIIRELLHEELTDIGYEVELTEDGADAIERYARARDSGQPFAALIMDLTIPGGMGGQEAIGKLLEIDPEAKVIVSSGYSTDPIMADFKEYGFSAVAAKPYSTEELEETLRGILKGKK